MNLTPSACLAAAFLPSLFLRRRALRAAARILRPGGCRRD